MFTACQEQQIAGVIRFSYIRYALILFACWLTLTVCQSALAHEDIDIGIEAVRLNKSCIAEITLVNKGRAIPSSFYRLPNPANLSLKKSNQTELLGSISFLDKNRNLQPTGGRLIVSSKKAYVNIPEFMRASLTFSGEYFDHGGDDNTLVEEIDCVLGQGQIQGRKKLPTQPDLAIKKAYVDSLNCKLAVELENLTSIPLSDNAWSLLDGVILMQLNLTTHNRLPDIPLINLDPKKQFTLKNQTLYWINPKPLMGVKSLRIGLWRVNGDADFKNNHFELTVPNTCF